MYRWIRDEKGEHKVFSPIYSWLWLRRSGIYCNWRIRLDVTLRVFQEREEILVGSESFDWP